MASVSAERFSLYVAGGFSLGGGRLASALAVQPVLPAFHALIQSWRIFEISEFTGHGVARHGKLPPRRHEELPPPWIAEERVNERGTNRGMLVVG